MANETYARPPDPWWGQWCGQPPGAQAEQGGAYEVNTFGDPNAFALSSWNNPDAPLVFYAGQ